MNENVKMDKRVIKTKKAIRNAFANLLVEKNLNMITIKDIANGADINRKTFYNHYEGVYQLLDEIENEIAASFVEALQDIDLKKEFQNPKEIFRVLTEIINSDLHFYGHLMGMEQNANLISKLTTILKQQLHDAFAAEIDIDDNTLELIMDYTISGMVSVYQSWFNSDQEESLDDIAKKVNLLTESAVQGLLKSQK